MFKYSVFKCFTFCGEEAMNLDTCPWNRDLLLHGFANSAFLCIMHFSVIQGFSNVEVLFLIAYFTCPLTVRLE